MIVRAPLLSALLTLAAAAPRAQAPDELLARYRLHDRAATVTRADVALEMAMQQRRQQRGREAVDMLVDTRLIRAAAERQGLLPSESDVRQFWRELQQQLRAAGRRPEEFAAVRNTDERQWLQDLSTQLAQERLVRKELELGEREQVSGDMLKLWVAEARKKGDVVVDPDLLPVGVAARVGSHTVPLIELGMLLLRTSEDQERDEFVQKLVLLEAIEAEARALSLEVTAADLDLAIEQRRREVARDPRFRAVAFESLLEAQGMTVASLRQGRVFRAHVLLDKLAAVKHPDAALQQLLADSRQQVLAEVGPRRRVGVIMVRASDRPNALIERDFAQAEKHLLRVRERISKDGFAATASIESEESESKQRGGDVGWHRAASEQLPEPLRKAAFAMELGEVSMPVRTEDACFLVTVLEIEPTPRDEELVARLRTVRTQELREQLLRDAHVELVTHGGAK